MVKLIALYRHPEDKEAFDKHYAKTHTPLAKAMPGLQKIEVTKLKTTPMGGEPDYYLMAEMYFVDRVSLDAAMASPEGKAAAKDLGEFARKLVSMTIGEVMES